MMVEYYGDDYEDNTRWSDLFPDEADGIESKSIIVSFVGNGRREHSLTELDWAGIIDD